SMETAPSVHAPRRTHLSRAESPTPSICSWITAPRRLSSAPRDPYSKTPFGHGCKWVFKKSGLYRAGSRSAGSARGGHQGRVPWTSNLTGCQKLSSCPFRPEHVQCRVPSVLRDDRASSLRL